MASKRRNKKYVQFVILMQQWGKSDGGGGDGSGGGDDGAVVSGPSGSDNTQQLVQALVDNGIIQLNHKATIRVIETTGHQTNQTADIADLKTLSLGTFAVRQSTDTRSGLVLETVGDSGDDPKMVIQQNTSRPTAILVQRNLVLAAAAAVANGGAGCGTASGSAAKVTAAVGSSGAPGVLQIVRHQPHHMQSHPNAVVANAGSSSSLGEAKAPPPASDKPPPQTSSGKSRLLYLSHLQAPWSITAYERRDISRNRAAYGFSWKIRH
ncbi:hypothetical protein AAG570_009310 [Ranatra chinensis]|uniref:Uncharacterized protein n=1 Tax=Ranatra chinensis TaxID=642074 RepID=A0ABD0YQU4_9HEMI